MKNTDKKYFIFFSGPAVFTFITVVIIPFIYGGYMTLSDWNGISKESNIVGIKNYVSVLHNEEFWISLRLTLFYVLVSAVLVNIVAFFLAYLLTSGVKGQKFMRSGFFVPNLIGGIVLGYIWQFVFSRVFVLIGKSLGWEFLSKSWLADPKLAIWGIIFVTVWQIAGYNMLIYIAGFTGVSQDIIEASRIDGCSEIQVTRYIRLPLMINSFVICFFLSLTRGFMVYDLNLSLTEGGPFNSTKMIAMHIYQQAFTAYKYGEGQAEAIVIFIITAVIAGLQVWMGKQKEVENA